MELNHHRGGRGEPLVLIHGIGSRWQMWEPVLPLVEAEREVVAIDLPGFAGSTDPPPGTPAGAASLTSLVSAFLDRLGIEAPHVAGNSLGGLIALELARRGRARSATALSPAGFHTRPEGVYQRATLAAMVRSARALRARAEFVTRTGLRRRLLFSNVVAHPERMPAPDAAESVRALADASWFDATLSAIIEQPFSGGREIAVPVTLAWGEHDRLLVRRQALRALRQIPRARLLLLYGCGHVPTYDDPEQVARVLLDSSRA